MSMQTEQLTIDLVRIQDIRTVAVLLAYGFHEHTRERGNRPGHVAFKVMVPNTRRQEFDEIIQRCQQGFNIVLPGGTRTDGTKLPTLGDYERCNAHVRDAIREFNEYSCKIKETAKHERQSDTTDTTDTTERSTTE